MLRPCQLLPGVPTTIVVSGGMNIIMRKSGIVVFGETPAMHGRMINTRMFFIDSSLTEEVKEYTNLEIYKNYCGSFATNIDENITKARKKAGMLFSDRSDRRRTDPLVYFKIWKQACIPCLLFGSEL